MKKKLALALSFVAILASHFILDAQAACTNNFPSSLNNYTSGQCIPSAWGNALEAKMGINKSAVTTSLDYQINAIFTSYGSEQVASSAISWINYETASSPSSTWLKPGNNLSELTSTSTARTNLGLTQTATLASTTWLKVSNNLSDLNSTSSARTNIGFTNGTNISISGLGAISFNGTLPIANGGTATTTAPADGQYFGANSAVPTWKSFIAGNNISLTNTTTGTIIAAISSSTAAGNDTYVQYNNGGTFGATSTFTFTSSTKTLSVLNFTVTGFVSSTSLFQRQIFTTTTAWTVPTNTTMIFVSGIGPGGGGGGGKQGVNSGGGGGSGAYILRMPTSTTPGSVITITIGATGQGGNQATGTAGGQTSINNWIILNGGGGGGIGPAGIGATSSVAGVFLTGNSASGTAGGGAAGGGGASLLSPGWICVGGNGGSAGGGDAATSTVGYGCGGGGGGQNGATNGLGAAATPSIVYIEY